MPTYTNFLNANTQPPARGALPFDKYKSALIDWTVQNTVQSDVLDVLQLPAGVIIMDVWLEIITPEGATSTVSVGITGGTTNGWLNAVDLNATLDTTTGKYYYCPANESATYMATKVKTTAPTTISLLMNTSHTTATAQAYLYALVLPLSMEG